VLEILLFLIPQDKSEDIFGKAKYVSVFFSKQLNLNSPRKIPGYQLCILPLQFSFRHCQSFPENPKHKLLDEHSSSKNNLWSNLLSEKPKTVRRYI
jgi:hypothetical protein